MAAKGKNKKVELHLSRVIEETVTIEVKMSTDLMNVFNTISKDINCPKDTDKVEAMFVEVITNGLKNELLRFSKRKFKGNTNIGSNAVN